MKILIKLIAAMGFDTWQNYVKVAHPYPQMIGPINTPPFMPLQLILTSFQSVLL
jgi:hypothetical protein